MTRAPLTALVVDDRPDNIGVIIDVLARAGFRVLVAEDGEDALATVARAEPDVILLDVGLPGIDGFETCRRLRASGCEVPVLFVTALDDTTGRVRGYAVGGDDFVSKPFRADELLARARAYATVTALQRCIREARALFDRNEPVAARARLNDDDERA